MRLAGRSYATVRDGEQIFQAIGCGTCHVPALTTGVSTNPLFNRKPCRCSPIWTSLGPYWKNFRLGVSWPCVRPHTACGRRQPAQE